MSTKQILGILLVLILMAGSAIAGAAGGALLVYRLQQPGLSAWQQQIEEKLAALPGASSAAPAVSPAIQVQTSDIQTSITAVAQKVGPAVVTVVGKTEMMLTPFGFSNSSEVSGSGVFISADGYLLTNHHVVRSSQSGALAEGLGFAIPANTVQAVASQIIETGRFSRPYLGIERQVITPRIARYYRLPVEYGVYVTEVSSSSPADQAGVRPGDIITRIGDTPLDETHSYINTLFQYQPGETVTLWINREGEELKVQATLGGD